MDVNEKKEEVKQEINSQSAIISKLLNQTDIVDLMTKNGVSLKKEKIFYRGSCPFHKDYAQGLVVDKEAGQWQCLECERGGNAISFIMCIKSCDFGSAVQVLAETLGEKIDIVDDKGKEFRQRLVQLNSDACLFWMQELYKCEPAMEYLKKRGINDDSKADYGLGFAKGDMSLYKNLKSKGYTDDEMEAAGIIKYSDEWKRYYETFFDRIVMPITNEEGEVLGFSGRRISVSKEKSESDSSGAKYLNTPSTYLFKKSENIFGLAQASSSSKPFVLVEGNFDVISLRQSGVKTAVAALGTALTMRQMSIIAEHNKKVFVGYDNDAAGKKAALKSIQALLKFGCCVKVVSPAPYKDFDEACQHESEKEIQERFVKSEDGVSYLLKNYLEENDYESVADLLLI